MHIVELKGAELSRIYPLIHTLNPEMSEAEFEALLKVMRPAGYRCVAAMEGEEMLGICGFWVGSKFWCRKFMDVDNLVVTEAARGKAVGALMLRWVEEEAKRLGCQLIDMPVYTHNTRAHRFYFREGYAIEGFYFTKRI